MRTYTLPAPYHRNCSHSLLLTCLSLRRGAPRFPCGYRLPSRCELPVLPEAVPRPACRPRTGCTANAAFLLVLLMLCTIFRVVMLVAPRLPGRACIKQV